MNHVGVLMTHNWIVEEGDSFRCVEPLRRLVGEPGRCIGCGVTVPPTAFLKTSHAKAPVEQRLDVLAYLVGRRDHDEN